MALQKIFYRQLVWYSWINCKTKQTRTLGRRKCDTSMGLEKTLSEEKLHKTKVLLQGGAGGKSIGCKSLLYCIRAWKNSVELLVVNLYFYFFIGLRFRVGHAIDSPAAQAQVFVRRISNFSKVNEWKI